MAAAVLPTLQAPPAFAEPFSALTRYPYLTDASGTYVTVNWATDRSATTAAAKWGRSEVGPQRSGAAAKWGRVGATGACTPAANVPATRTGISVRGVLQYQWKATFSVGSAAHSCYRVFLGSTSIDLLDTDPSPRARP